MKPPEPTGPAPALPSGPASVVVIKVAGRFKAFVGAEHEFGDSATCAARAAAAKHFGVPEQQIEIEPQTATLTARVRALPIAECRLPNAGGAGGAL